MSDTARVIFSGMQILIAGQWVTDHAVIVENKRISAIIPNDMIAHHLPASHRQFPAQYYLVPGFIDLHVHGIYGHDVMDNTEEALQSISQHLVEEGVTGFLATTMTAPQVQIETLLKMMPQVMTKVSGAEILGVHLEGPFIAVEKMGAQDGNLTLAPDINLMRKWQNMAEGAIKIVTAAPELPGAIPFFQALRGMGIIGAIGHTNATYAETNAAIDAGASYATHLFNAMRGVHQREPGATGALLLADHVVAELIVDGVHLHPAILELALRIKNHDHLLLVTDAMRAKCMKDGSYDLGGQSVTVKAGVATLADGRLAGSTLRMSDAIKNLTTLTNCSLADAISMASTGPAHKLGVHDRKGSIGVGKDADFVVMNPELDILLTVVAGREVFVK